MDIDLTGGASAGEHVTELLDAEPMNLPDGAELQPDGSVLLNLAYPRTFKTKRIGEEPSESTYRELVLHRLNGEDMRKVLAAPDSKATQVAAALSLRMRASEAAILMDKIDAADFSALATVVAALLDLGGDGLPEQVEEKDGVLVLPLRHPVLIEQGSISELGFNRMTGADLIQISRAKDTLPAAISCSTGLKLAVVQSMFDEMDGADIIAANRVIGFLSRSGRRTGR